MVEVAQVGKVEIGLDERRPVVPRHRPRAGRRPRSRAEGACCGGRRTPRRVSIPGTARAPRKPSTDSGAEGAPEGEAQPDPLWAPRRPLLPRGSAAPPWDAAPQSAGGVGEDLLHGLVALADAGETGGEGDAGDGKRGRLEQDASRLAALGPRNGQRSGADLGRDKAVQLSHAVAEPVGEPFDAFTVDDAVPEEPHGPGHDVGP